MLKECEVQTVLRLYFTDGLTQRQVARVTGVSRSAIGMIVSGNHCKKYNERRERRNKEAEGGDWHGEYVIYRHGKCETCGHVTQLPCVACRAEATLKESLAKKRKHLNSVKLK